MARRLGTLIWWQIFAVSVFCLFLLGFWLVGTTVTQLGTNALVWNRAFSDGAGRSVLSLLPEVLLGVYSSRTAPLREQRYLVLGKDEVEGSNRPITLTDTMIIVTYRPEDGVVRLLSLPRDIYLPEYGTKVNGLYALGEREHSGRPSEFVQEILQKKLGVPFDGTLEISLKELEEIVDKVGGVEVDVPQTFTDPLFPRSGVDVTKERDPKKLYETVTFEAGKQTLSGEQVGKYIRSRHSTNAAEGNDGARSRRQQQVIEALLQKLADPRLISRPGFIGELYAWYSQKYQAVVPVTTLGEVVGTIEQTSRIPTLEKVPLPVTDFSQATDSATLFVHPPIQKYRQWAYESVDPSWDNVRTFLKEKGL